MRVQLGVVAGAAALCLMLSQGEVANAKSPVHPSEQESPAAVAAVDDAHWIELVVIKGGEAERIDRRTVEARVVNMPSTPPPASDAVTPFLIDFDQWFRCFSLNEENDVFAEYTQYWDGTAHDVRLKCGNEKYGYKHIRADKEKRWQEEVDQGRSLGWVPEEQGVESWDDLMAFTTGEAILWPTYKGGDSFANTSCAVVEMGFYDIETDEVLYTFRATAAWANDSDRLITSFPTTRQVC